MNPDADRRISIAAHASCRLGVGSTTGGRWPVGSHGELAGQTEGDERRREQGRAVGKRGGAADRHLQHAGGHDGNRHPRYRRSGRASSWPRPTHVRCGRRPGRAPTSRSCTSSGARAPRRRAGSNTASPEEPDHQQLHDDARDGHGLDHEPATATHAVDRRADQRCDDEERREAHEQEARAPCCARRWGRRRRRTSRRGRPPSPPRRPSSPRG